MRAGNNITRCLNSFSWEVLRCGRNAARTFKALWTPQSKVLFLSPLPPFTLPMIFTLRMQPK